MDGWIEFGRGPLFRFAFVVMLLGIARLYVLQLTSLNGPFIKTRQVPCIPWHGLKRMWHLRVTSIRAHWKAVPVYSLVATAFHAGVIFVPLFLGAHVILWRESVGFSWTHIPQNIANTLTMIVFITGPWLFLMRVFSRKWRRESHLQDYIWPLLLSVPFASGYVCSNVDVSAAMYRNMMGIHILAADVIMILIPFTKVAQCMFMRIVTHDHHLEEVKSVEAALS